MGKTSSNGGGCGAGLASPIRRETSFKRGLSKGRFEEIYQKGKRVSGELCRLMALPGSGLIGYSTPRAVGSLARRNRLKRRFRAAVVSCVLPEGLDIVIAISAKADRAEFEAIVADLGKGLEQISERWESESGSS